MKKSLIETRFRQPSGQLSVIVIILFLLLLDQGFGIAQSLQTINMAVVANAAHVKSNVATPEWPSTDGIVVKSKTDNTAIDGPPQRNPQ